MKFLELTRHCVDLCFDVYKLSSIKDIKRGNKQTKRHFTFCPMQKFSDDINDVYDLYGSYIEGNTIVVFHNSYEGMVDPENTVISANDTDVSAILLRKVSK